MGKLAVTCFLILTLAFFYSPAVKARGVDWGKVKGQTVKVFYPGVASWEFLKGKDHGKGGPVVEKGEKPCAACHVSKEGKYDINTDNIISGKLKKVASWTPLEPNPMPDTKGFKDVEIKVAYDAENIYLRFQWEGSRASVKDASLAKDGKADRIAVQINDVMRVFKNYGCYIACHDDQKNMPGDAKKDISATGSYAGGKYTVVIKRKLSTGDPKDITTKEGSAFNIGIAVHDYFGTAWAKEVDWVSINPEIAGATYVKDSGKCLECHEDYMKTYGKTRHARVFKYGAKGEPQARDCEACHGPLSKHLDAPRRKPALVVSFKTITAQQKNNICLQCHENGLRMAWKSGLHQASGVSCDSCHYVMERRSDRALAINEDIKKACYNCHPDKKAQTLKASHMPVREGKIECSNCHNPHGSNNPGLLNAKGPFLCTRCHQYGGHVNMPRYNRASAPYGQGCINCHNRIHGSNHPSGAKFTR